MQAGLLSLTPPHTPLPHNSPAGRPRRRRSAGSGRRPGAEREREREGERVSTEGASHPPAASAAGARAFLLPRAAPWFPPLVPPVPGLAGVCVPSGGAGLTCPSMGRRAAGVCGAPAPAVLWKGQRVVGPPSLAGDRLCVRRGRALLMERGGVREVRACARARTGPLSVCVKSGGGDRGGADSVFSPPFTPPNKKLSPHATHEMDALLSAFQARPDTGNIEFWHGAERAGWLMKQGKEGGRGREACCCYAGALGLGVVAHTHALYPSSSTGEIIKTWRRR